MFKTDKKSLEILSHEFSARDIANLKAVLEFLKLKDLSTIAQEEFENIMRGLNTIGRLKLEGKVYAFHVHDAFVGRESRNDEGVELYLRQGDTLQEFLVHPTRDYVYQIGKAICSLHEANINTIYTGDIPASGFLGIHRTCDSDAPITKERLGNSEIEIFEDKEINVIELDSLI